MAHITIDADRCKGCYFCIKFCPKQIIIVSDRHNRVGYFPARFSENGEEQCTACKTCALMCPDNAIEVFK